MQGVFEKKFCETEYFFAISRNRENSGGFCIPISLVAGLGGEKARSDSEVERDFERRTDPEVRIALPHGRGAGAPFGAV